MRTQRTRVRKLGGLPVMSRPMRNTLAANHSAPAAPAAAHNPEIIVIDEIGRELEAMAARTIAERGVQLIGTAHGNSLENLMMNPTLSDLIGGIQSVTLSDEEARRRGTQKSILERKAPPTFGIMVEIISRDEVAVHRDVAATVDATLRGTAPRTELRQREADGSIAVSALDPRRDPRQQKSGREPEARGIVDISSRQPRTVVASETDDSRLEPVHDDLPDDVVPPMPRGRGTAAKPLRVYPFGVSRNRLELAIEQLGVPAVVVRDSRDADLVMTLKNYFRRKPQPIRDAEMHGTPVYVLRANTAVQMEAVLTGLFPSARTPRGDERASVRGEPAPTRAPQRDDPVLRAMTEAEEAISAVMQGEDAIALAPQPTQVRRLQHQLAERYNVASRSRGREPHRRVEIYTMYGQ